VPSAHRICRLPGIEGDKPKRQRFRRYPIGIFRMNLAEGRPPKASSEELDYRPSLQAATAKVNL